MLGQFVGTTKLKGNDTWTIRCLQQGSGLETISVLCTSSCCYTSIHTLLSQLPGRLEQPFSDYLNLLVICCTITSPDLPLYGNDGFMGRSSLELVIQTKWDLGGQIIRDQAHLSVAYEFARASIQLGPSDILLFVPMLPVHWYCTMTHTTRKAMKIIDSLARDELKVQGKLQLFEHLRIHIEVVVSSCKAYNLTTLQASISKHFVGSWWFF